MSPVSTLCSAPGGRWSNTLLNRVIISLSWLIKSLDHLLQAEDGQTLAFLTPSDTVRQH